MRAFVRCGVGWASLHLVILLLHKLPACLAQKRKRERKESSCSTAFRALAYPYLALVTRTFIPTRILWLGYERVSV